MNKVNTQDMTMQPKPMSSTIDAQAPWNRKERYDEGQVHQAE